MLDVKEQMLEVKDLSAGYGPITALDKVSFSAARGQITAVLGANGAGKTTLLRTVSGLHRCQSGAVDFDGRRTERAPAEDMPALGLSHVPEGRGLITELTVEENLRLGALLGAARRRTPRGAQAERASTQRGLAQVYEMFPPLAQRRRQDAHVLSGGERQMLVIGRALLTGPSVLLLDEPSLGLAPRVVAQIFQLLRGLVDAEGTTVLLVEQNARSALSIADAGIVLNLGRVVAREAAATLAADETLRHAYLGF